MSNSESDILFFHMMLQVLNTFKYLKLQKATFGPCKACCSTGSLSPLLCMEKYNLKWELIILPNLISYLYNLDFIFLKIILLFSY